jgi:hypothetical protein
MGLLFARAKINLRIMNVYPAFVILLYLGAFTCSCGRANQSPSAETIVEWPALTALDVTYLQAHDALHENRPEDAKKLFLEMKTRAETLMIAGVPSNAGNRDEVASLLEVDLKSLFEFDGEVPPDFDQRVHAIHALMAKMMDRAGVAHQHDHEH